MRAALGLPAVLFSFARLVVAGYWLVVPIGGAGGVDAFDGGDGVHADAAGIPLAIIVSTGVFIAWFVS